MAARPDPDEAEYFIKLDQFRQRTDFAWGGELCANLFGRIIDLLPLLRRRLGDPYIPQYKGTGPQAESKAVL